MKDCNNCKYKDYWEHVEPCASCTNLMGEPTHWKPQTNYDRIRAMSDEELAHFMARVCPPGGKCNEDGNCFICRRDWLKSPVEGGVD